MESTRKSWNTAFKEGLDYDSWGQVEEALSCYKRLQVATALEGTENKLGLQGKRRAAIVQLSSALRLRIQELTASTTPALVPGLGLSGMQALRPYVAGMIVSDVQLPQQVALALKSAAAATSVQADAHSSAATISSGLQQLRLQPGSKQGVAREELITAIMEPQESAELSRMQGPLGWHGTTQQQPQQPKASSTSGTLRTAVTDVQPGDVTLSISFGSWSVKGADSMAQPHVQLTVRDKRGKLLEAVQQSPQVCASRSGADALDLDFVWHLQTPLNCLPEDAAVFMELLHYKADKKKMSVKCYALLAYDELVRPGAAMLALHRKPADYKRRGQHPAYTSKPMYLHIVRTLAKH